jgi:VCBS repeat-containing protein
MSLAQVFSGFRLTPGRRLPPLLRSRDGADGSGAVAGAGWAGGLSLIALIFSALKEARAADPDVSLFDHGTITYKDFEHGSFELVTKEAVPRHIVVDDPGQTVVLSKVGSSVSFAQVTNSASRMEDLQTQQQDVLANYAKDHGAPGSSTPPGETTETSPQPINFVEPDGPAPQRALPTLVIPASFIPDAPLVHSPPTLTLGSGPIEVDTVAFDKFSATDGNFSATSFGSGAAPTFGIAGGVVGPVVIAGATYNVEKPGSFGILYLNSTTGAYTYVPNNDAINALKAPTTDNFTITASDGLASANQTFTVDINGTDDASVISGAVAGSVVEAAAGARGVPSASGILTDTDVDDPANTFTAVSSPHASSHGYGSFTITTDGHWTYTLNDGNPAVQALNVGQMLTDTFTVTTIGGTPQQVSVTIQGSNDPAVISGDTRGYVVEAGGIHNATHGVPIATGLLTDTDVDNPDNTFMAVSLPHASDHGYGSFTITVDGHWTYTLDNGNCAVQALNVGQTLTDSFVVNTVDGTAQTVIITIDGSNDAAIIRGDTRGCVVEAGGIHNAHGVPTATGLLTDTDIDNPDNTFAAVSSPQTSDHGYGSFTMTADGHWTYTLDDGNCAVQALNVGQTLTDSFVVNTIDGTAQTVTIAIEGSNDAAVVCGDTHGCVVEAGGVHNNAHGVPTATGLLTDTDVDNLDNTFAAVSCPQTSDHGYGSFTMTADGHWTYALDNGNCAVQALNVGQTLTDSFVVNTIDGTAQTVGITIEGSNDAAVICGDTHGCVVEPSRSCDPPPSASGTLTDSDVDNPDNTFAAVSCAQTSDQGYGSFTMTADGRWTYTLDDSNCAVRALNACDTLTDTFTVTTIDGTAQTVTMTIQGADDAGLHDFHRQANFSSFGFNGDAGLQRSSVSAPSTDLSAAASSRDSWRGSSSEGGEAHLADESPDAFHFPGHADTAAIGAAFQASHHDLIA